MAQPLTDTSLSRYLCHRTQNSIMLPILNSGHNVESEPKKKCMCFDN